MQRLLGYLFAASIVAASQPITFAQAEAIGVTLTGIGFEYFDSFDFRPTGKLHAGGIESWAIRSVRVPRTETRTSYRDVYSFENGQLIVRKVPFTYTVTVYDTVQEQIAIRLPEINGVWYGARPSWWSINSIGNGKAIVGTGTRNGDSVDGVVVYMNPGSTPPTGIYRVKTAPEASSPAESR